MLLLQDLYGRSQLQPRSVSQPPTRDAAQHNAMASSKSFTTSLPSAMQGILSSSSGNMVDEAVHAIRTGMRARGAHGGLALERVLRESRMNCSGVGATLGCGG